MQLKNITNPKNRIMSDRSSIRRYDPNVKISREEMKQILQDAMTAPSSFNLQPWRFVVIDTDEGKQMLKPFMMFNEVQCATSSAVVALFADMNNVESANKIYESYVDNSLLTAEKKDWMVQMINEYQKNFTVERVKNSCFFDCGLVAMQFMLSAKNYGYDTNPIGGYLKRELTEALKLDTDRYVPVLLISIGKAVEEPHSSIRYSVDEITKWV
ncbi:MAG: nitroreductase family protein [Dysgonomonas sp.]